MIVHNETRDFDDLLHGVVVYMRNFMHAQTQNLTVLFNSNGSNSHITPHVIPAMQQLAILGLGELTITTDGQITSYEFHKVSSQIFRNNLPLHNSIRKLGLDVEYVLQILESGEIKRYPN